MRARWNLTAIGLGVAVAIATVLQGLDIGGSSSVVRPYLVAASALTGLVAAWQLIVTERMSRIERRHWATDALASADPRRVGSYRILGRLGSGAMGRVYLGVAKDGSLVAAKVVRPELADDPDFRKRFKREIAAIRSVTGRYTLPLLDANVEAAQPWFVTPYVPGGSLQEAIDTHGPFAEREVWRLAGGVAEALVDIHRAGLVHRDLKPGNILLAPDGPRVIDFGISRAVDASQLTATMVRPGTPGFMAPEQVKGEAVGPAADVFAFGLLLSYAATGRPPFGQGASDVVLFRVLREDPDLTGLEGPLRSLIERCTSKDPHQRPTPDQIVAECSKRVEATREVWPSRPDGNRPAVVTAPVLRRWSIAAGLVVLVVAFGTAAFQLRTIDQGSPASAPTRSTSPTATTRTVPTATTRTVQPTISPSPPASTGTGVALPAGGGSPVIPAPATPSGATATVFGGQFVRYQWTDNADNEDGFRIEMRTWPFWDELDQSSNPETVYSSVNVSADQTEYTWGPGGPQTNVCFNVVSYNSGGEGFSWDNFVCTITEASPEAASNVSLTRMDANTIRLQWTDNSTRETAFRLVKTMDPKEFVTLDPGTTQYDWGGLPSGSGICVRVDTMVPGDVLYGDSPYCM